MLLAGDFMKVAISTTKGGLDDIVCPDFGRCPNFTVVEINEGTKEITRTEVIENASAQANEEAGVAAAEKIIGIGAVALITGSCGPTACEVFESANIQVYVSSGTVKKAIGDMLAGLLEKSCIPKVPANLSKEQEEALPFKCGCERG